MGFFDKLFLEGKKMPVVDRILIGEALVIEDNDLKNAAHIDLIMGPRGSAAEDAFCNALTNQKEGHNAVLAAVAPNLMVKPATVVFNKVTIKSSKQAIQMFGPAQLGVAMAVAGCVEDGTIPANEAEDVFICIGVFIDSKADNDTRIQDWNYKAAKLAIKRAVAREPKVSEVIEQKRKAQHPVGVHP
jgi:5,6,7,8-tetrahydromethanopterin hydro-lyase